MDEISALPVSPAGAITVSFTVLPRSFPRVVRPTLVLELATRRVMAGNLETGLDSFMLTGLDRMLPHPTLERCANLAANMVLN